MGCETFLLSKKVCVKYVKTPALARPHDCPSLRQPLPGCLYPLACDGHSMVAPPRNIPADTPNASVVRHDAGAALALWHRKQPVQISLSDCVHGLVPLVGLVRKAYAIF